MSTVNVNEAIARARQIIADKQAAILAKKLAAEQAAANAINLTIATPLTVEHQNRAVGGMQWNEEQQTAIDYAVYRKSFCLIGAAGTGKTTTLKGAIKAMQEQNVLPMLESSTKFLAAGSPGIALISYTRRAVRNMAKQMPPELKDHCITFHKLVQYEPVRYVAWNQETLKDETTVRFEPTKHQGNPLPRNLRVIIVEESSMLSTDYFKQVIDALPNPSQVQFIFLGDLNQLPPVYGQAILGKKLLELPIIELTRVYRQALESPIISMALAVKNNDFSQFQRDAVDVFGVSPKFMYGDGRPNNPINYAASFDPASIKEKTVLEKAGRGKVTLHPWKKNLTQEDGLDRMQMQTRMWIKSGEYDPNEDLVLCPWNKSFGTDELNKSIADFLGRERGALVYEVIAGYEKHYLAVGDKLMVDKQECLVTAIDWNPKYLGKRPQPAHKDLTRWGMLPSHANMFTEEHAMTNADVDAMLEHAATVDDRVTACSHVLKVRFLDSGEEDTIADAVTINLSSFAYAITVHKAQGSECRRVFIILHSCHAAMCSRELIYTAITRAAEELYIVMPPNLLASAARKPRIKGDTLAAKLEYFNSRFEEKAE